MMERYAIVESGLVTNIVIWDGVSRWPVPDGTVVVKAPEGIFVDIGSTYLDGVFTAPPSDLA